MTVDAMVVCLDRLGLAVSILRHGGMIRLRRVTLHGAIIASDAAACLEGVAVLQSIRLLRYCVATAGEETQYLGTA